ncbi:alpha/beta hydrolase [Solicola gregarius]|uniref:Secreted protein n=1 Tax=Solicola gregarius TaxID=2908642 RepID=A0AA46TL77_9ACTN|nr:hypothetical protein [Solicola gregarius]UYM06962.1 hypothetical protein L0C25_07765 [Solicola gregarius]
MEANNTDDLEVWLGSRRLDGATPPLRSGDLADLIQAEPRDVGVDPAEPGEHETTSFEYRYGTLPWKRYPGDMEVLGQAVLPEGVDDAPLVLFLHGRHQACYGKGENGSWPCAGDSKPVPSFRGYTYLQQRLATQGYATVSISANAINQQDYRDADGGAAARSKLIRHHLKLLAEKTSESGNRWSGRLDMDQVVLVGHSRGGEGANQAVVDSGGSAPYSIVGQLLLAPTDFSQHTAGYAPTAVTLPYCDGDVSDLQGQKFVDASAGLAADDTSLRSSILVRGANHNFFNTEWTPGISAAPSFDDWGDQGDKVCGRKASETRLSPREQRKVGLTLTTGAVRMFVQRDPEMLALFDAPGALTTKSMGANGLVWSHAIGGARTPVRAGVDATVSGAARECLATTGVKSADGLRSCAAGVADGGREVHWMQPFSGTVSRAVLHEARLDWSRSGRSGGLTFDEPLDLDADGRTLDLRMIASKGVPNVRVELRDTTGGTWSRTVKTLRLPGGRWLRPAWAQTVRLDPPSASADFDPAAVASVRIVSGNDSGTAWIVDGAARDASLPDVPDRTLPRLLLGNAEKKEGDQGKGIIRLPYRLAGSVSSASSFDVLIEKPRGKPRTRLVHVNVPAGKRGGSIALHYARNKLDDRDRSVFRAIAQPVRGVALHKYQGSAVVLDDDPAPKVVIEPKRKTYRAGQPIRMRLKLSKAVGFPMQVSVRLRDAKGFAPMRGVDVPKKWLRRHGDPSHPKRKLSKSVYSVSVRVPTGKRVGVLTIPTVRRGAKAPVKRLRLVWRVAHHEPRTTVATVRPPRG